MERSKNILIAALSLACLCLPGCSQEEPSPSPFPGYFTPEGQYIDFEDRNESLPAPFDRIKLDYYRQEFVGKGIDRDSEFAKVLRDYPYGDGSGAYSAPSSHFIGMSSLYLSNYYGIIDGAYLLSFYINGHGSALGWGGFQTYVFGSHSFFTHTFVPPVFWKDGRIYSLGDALTLGVVSDKSVDQWLLSLYGTPDGESGTLRDYRLLQQSADEHGEELNWEVILEAPTSIISYGLLVSMSVLPPLESEAPQ